MAPKATEDEDTAVTEKAPVTVDVAVQTDDVDEIEINIAGTRIHLPARIEDWPAEATSLIAQGEFYGAIKVAMRPVELTRFQRLRLTLASVLDVWNAYAKAAGLGSAGE